MTPAEIQSLADQAGLETGEAFPSDTPWRRRFVELLAEAQTGIVFAANERMRAVAECQAEFVDRTARENAALREALDYYATSSNWRREVRNVGPRINWTKAPVLFDRGARAKFVLMTTEFAK